jgi:hypothetical protein
MSYQIKCLQLDSSAYTSGIIPPTPEKITKQPPKKERKPSKAAPRPKKPPRKQKTIKEKENTPKEAYLDFSEIEKHSLVVSDVSPVVDAEEAKDDLVQQTSTPLAARSRKPILCLSQVDVSSVDRPSDVAQPSDVNVPDCREVSACSENLNLLNISSLSCIEEDASVLDESASSMFFFAVDSEVFLYFPLSFRIPLCFH